MNKFCDFGIAPERDHFVGDKIRIMKVLNQPLIIHDYKLSQSKFEDSSDVMHLQIEFKEEMKVLFTASKVLKKQIDKVPKESFPFETVIIKEGESFCFT